MADFHGIKIIEASDGARSLTVPSTSVIGIVATAPDAKAGAFPLDTPVLVTNTDAAITDAGPTGTLATSLRAIADQVKTPIVVVVVAEGDDAAETNLAVIGGSVDGRKTGMQALLAAEARVGVRPRILGVPGLDSHAVTTELVTIARKLRAMVYASANGATVGEAVAYRGHFSARELMLIFPDFIGTNGATSHAVARALGLRARIDQETGFHKTISNVAVDGVMGLTRDIDFDMMSSDTEAGILNAAQVTALVRAGGGYRFYGNRTCSEDPLFAFESAARTAHVLIDTIANGMLWAIDKPLKPSLVKDIVETVNGQLRAMKSSGLLIGGRAWFDADKNTRATLSAGKVTIDYDYTPVPPLEQLGLTQRITDSYFADFSAGLSA